MSNIANFNAVNPAAPTGFTNLVWQSDTSGNVSAYMPLASGANAGAVVTGATGHTVPYLDVANSWSAQQTFLGGFAATILFANSLRLAVATKTANYAIVGGTDYMVGFNCTSGNLTATLPTLPGSPANYFYIFVIKKTDASANTLTISGANTIDGAASVVLTTQYQSVTVIANITSWFIVAKV